MVSSLFFFFNDTATTEIYTLSLHDALPDLGGLIRKSRTCSSNAAATTGATARRRRDRKSTRLNSSHQIISYAVFCLKKKRWSSISWLVKTQTSCRSPLILHY